MTFYFLLLFQTSPIVKSLIFLIKKRVPAFHHSNAFLYALRAKFSIRDMFVDASLRLILTNYMSMVLGQLVVMMLWGAMAPSENQVTMKLESFHPIKYFSNLVKFISEEKLGSLVSSD